MAVRIQMVDEHEAFEQIADLGQLAAFQAEMADAAPRANTVYDIVVMTDRQTYEEWVAQ